MLNLPRRRVAFITVGVMLSLLMSSVEATVVSTAMPTIVAQLGDLASYSWVFSAYMLASTTTVPLYGKLADLFGRRKLYIVAMTLFLVGSLLCGLARSMNQLVLFRAIQGLGAGGLLPLAFIIIGDIYTLEQRARIQGLFSGVWGLSSVLGPLVGGILVDRVGWQWIFLMNIGPGLLALAVVASVMPDRTRAPDAPRVPVDFAGAATLTTGLLLLLLGLFELGDRGLTPQVALLLGGALGLLALLLWIESRAREPIVPLGLFRDRLFAIACLHGLMAGWAVFGTASYVPLYARALLGASATEAGTTLTPQLLAWVSASIIGSRILLRVGFRSMVITGMVLLVIGSVQLAMLSADSSRVSAMVALAFTGVGMGLSIPAFLIAVQNSVPREQLGTATATVQFSRSIGGTLGVSVMGAVMSARLASALRGAGREPGSIDVAQLLDPAAGASAALDTVAQGALEGALQWVFGIALVVAVLGLLATLFTPRVELAAREQERKEPTAGRTETQRRQERQDAKANM